MLPRTGTEEGRAGREVKQTELPSACGTRKRPGAFLDDMAQTGQPTEPRSILATDCGSTTTKAILIEREGDEYRLRVRGEAPTTVEAPYEDVTRGVLNAVAEVEEFSGRKLLEGGEIIRPQSDGVGVDLYLSTSSAGGGLQMMVAGLVRTMTAESAQRAALGAGAIVMDVISLDDKRYPHERIQRMRELRPDMVLLSGGTDDSQDKRVVQLAEQVGAANIRARLGAKYELPVIYAGSQRARDDVNSTLADRTTLSLVENLRPTLDEENLQPARLQIQELFLEHVMAQAPGYPTLMAWTDAPIMPTPAAVGSIIQRLSEEEGINIIGVDIGGATTDVFSVFDGTFNRTVSASLGMSYSASNVLAQTGAENVRRWCYGQSEVADLGNRVRNKMIRPTTIPQSLEELIIEQALAREALRLALEQHKDLAVGLKGVRQERTISEAFSQARTGKTLVDMMALDWIVGSGGVLSHAPRRAQAAMMMIDAFQPEGITWLGVDSIFMMPQLGVLAEVHPQAATQVFQRDCLVPLGTCIAPVGRGRPGERCVGIEIEGGGALEVQAGEVRRIALPAGETRSARIAPARTFDAGWGRGRAGKVEVRGGEVGLIIDGRGRPLELPEDEEMGRGWISEMELYPTQ